MNDAFVRAYPPAVPPTGPSIQLAFVDDGVVVERRGDTVGLVVGEAAVDWTPIYLGALGGIPVLAGDTAASDEIEAPLVAMGVRELYGLVSDDEYALVGYASQLLHWRRTSRYCPVCGTAAVDRDGDWGRLCPSCGHIAYPHVTPATLILIHDGADKILLGHKAGWGDRYSILAGFVEPGESLEECVMREAFEEAGVVIDSLEYAGSQPWPFPHQLMIGFRARCDAGDVRFDGIELDDARWFAVDALPSLPPPVSLSRQMIDAWIASRA